MEDVFSRLLAALEGKAEFSPADFAALNSALEGHSSHESIERGAELLKALALQRDMQFTVGDVSGVGNAIGPFARSFVIQGVDPDKLFASLQALRQQITQDAAVERQVATAEAAAAYKAALRAYCATLPYVSLQQANLPTLDQTYVPLRVQSQDAQPAAANATDATEQRLSRDGWGQKPESSKSVTDVFAETSRHLLILGLPGSGKSSLLRKAAEKTLNTGAGGLQQTVQLPIIVPLRRLAQAEGTLETRLARVIETELSLVRGLPPGFLTDWPRLLNIRWLILLDALDEVAPEKRGEFLQWLRPFLANDAAYRMVITARAAAYQPGELGSGTLETYYLLPFNAAQRGAFAQAWFGGEARDFLAQAARMQASEVRSTPLLLTLAASVYREKGALPEHSTDLYDVFVTTWLQEAGRRGLNDALDPRTTPLAQRALTELAWSLTSRPTESSLKALAAVAASYLQKALALSPDEAAAQGERFIRAMAQYSGIFIRQGDDYQFLHPTFREYLTARKLVDGWKTSRSPADFWRFIAGRWQDPGALELIRFAVSAAAAEPDLHFAVDSRLEADLVDALNYMPGDAQRLRSRQNRRLRGAGAGIAVVLWLVYGASAGIGYMLILPFALLLLAVPVLLVVNWVRVNNRKPRPFPNDEALSPEAAEDIRQQRRSATSAAVLGVLGSAGKSAAARKALAQASEKLLSSAQAIAVAQALSETDAQDHDSDVILKVASAERLPDIRTRNLAPFLLADVEAMKDTVKLSARLQESLDAVDTLYQAEHADALLALAKNSGLFEQVRAAALQALVRLGSDKSTVAWAAIACDRSIDNYRSYLELPSVPELTASRAAEETLSAARFFGASPDVITALTSLAVGARHLDARMDACTTLDALGQAEAAQNALLRLASDAGTVRRLQAEALATLGGQRSFQQQRLEGRIYDSIASGPSVLNLSTGKTDQDEMRETLDYLHAQWTQQAKAGAEILIAEAQTAHSQRLAAFEAYREAAPPAASDALAVTLSQDVSAAISAHFAEVLQQRGQAEAATSAWLRLLLVDANGLAQAASSVLPRAAASLDGNYSSGDLLTYALAQQQIQTWAALRLQAAKALRALGSLDIVVQALKTVPSTLEGLPTAQAEHIGRSDTLRFTPEAGRTWADICPPLPDLWFTEKAQAQSAVAAQAGAGRFAVPPSILRMSGPPSTGAAPAQPPYTRWCMHVIAALQQAGWQEAIDAIAAADLPETLRQTAANAQNHTPHENTT